MLTPELLGHFRTRLEQRRVELQAEIADIQRQIADPQVAEDAVSDYGDDGNMLFVHEEAFGDLARLKRTLAAVEHALRRVEDGTYGYSESSGAPIPLERLEALPYATTLVGEQAPAFGSEGPDR